MSKRWVIINSAIVRCLQLWCCTQVTVEANSATANRAVITALFPLHTGSGCGEVNSEAVQQMEAADAAVRKLNAERYLSGISIGLRVFDTCGDPGHSVQMALKAIVEADAGLCGQTKEVFLGFLGPMNEVSLRAVHKVTQLFDLPHVVAVEMDGTRLQNVHYAVAIDHAATGKMIASILKQMSWTYFVMMASNTPKYINVARAVESEARSVGICGHIVTTISEITPQDAAVINKKMRIAERAGGVVIIAERKHISSFFTFAKENNFTRATIVLVDAGGSAEGREFMKSYQGNLLVLNTSQDLHEELCKSPQHVNRTHCTPDSTLAWRGRSTRGVVNSIFLYAAALARAHFSSCSRRPGFCDKLSDVMAQEWQEYIRFSRFTYREEYSEFLTSDIELEMKESPIVDILFLDAASNELHKVGTHNATGLFLDSPLPVSHCAPDCASYCAEEVRTANVLKSRIFRNTDHERHSDNHKLQREMDLVHFISILTVTGVVLILCLAFFMYYLFQLFKHGFHL